MWIGGACRGEDAPSSVFGSIGGKAQRLAADGEHNRPGDDVQIDADTLAERGDLNDRHPATVNG